MSASVLLNSHGFPDGAYFVDTDEHRNNTFVYMAVSALATGEPLTRGITAALDARPPLPREESVVQVSVPAQAISSKDCH